jgi:hypothetical protein
MVSIISRRLVSWIGVAIMLLSLTVLASEPQPVAAAGVTVSVTPVGSGLQFAASSSSAVTWDIWISTSSILTSPAPPHFQTGGSLPARVKHFASSTLQSTYSPAFSQLGNSTIYNYIVRGGSSYATGFAKTLTRKVTVEFARIDVLDDSDDVSAGDLTFYFRNPNDGTFDKHIGEVYVSSGAAVPMPERPGIRYDFFANSSTLLLAIQGVDDDCDFFDICQGFWYPDLSTGSSNDFDWATAQLSINIPQFAGLNQNFTSKQVTFQTTANRLKFKVTAVVTVEYSGKVIV